MRISLRTVLALAIMLSLNPALHAQIQAARDGGTRELLVSIFVPPVSQAPFSLTLATEWTRPFSGGGTYTLVNTRHIQRDSEGRIYEERWLLVPKGGKVQSIMTSIEISDPVAHVSYNCFLGTKTCSLRSYTRSAEASYKPAPGLNGALPSGDGFATYEELGTSVVEGLETTGSRETRTLNPGTYGNDQPMVTTREYWFSPKLGINLISRLESPQSGKQTFTVKELSLSEPEPQTFAAPERYSIVDEREERPAAR